jgi:hypothetical protein
MRSNFDCVVQFTNQLTRIDSQLVVEFDIVDPTNMPTVEAVFGNMCFLTLDFVINNVPTGNEERL